MAANELQLRNGTSAVLLMTIWLQIFFGKIDQVLESFTHGNDTIKVIVWQSILTNVDSISTYFDPER